MAENGSFQAQRSDNPRTPEDDEDGGEEEEDQGFGELQGLSEPQLGSELGSCGAALRENQSETLAVLESDQCAGLQVNSSVEEREGEEFKEQVGVSSQEVLASITVQALEGQIQNQLQSATCPMSPLELQPISVAQPISSAPSPTLVEQKALSLKENICSPDMEQQNPSKLNPISTIAVVKTPTSDGFNWRKYGQKLVKSPEGSRSYYKCTFSECCAKRVESCDHSGRVVEMVYKGQHNHDPPQKSSCARGKRLSSTQRILCNSIVEQPARMFNESSPSISSKEPVEDASSAPERKRLNSSNSDENDGILVKEEGVNEPEPKRRVKNGKLAYSGPPLKPGKKPKFVVHAACDVGISADGYRWRKYGQKMVKGNPHPRNYYRCTSAGCPVRKHIETTVVNTSAMIITYKGIHDHDMPVPKKRHGPPSAPLVAAMNNAQSKKAETIQNQISSTQWSVDKEGELTGEALDLGGEKAMESARTLLSIGFEIKPY